MELSNIAANAATLLTPSILLFLAAALIAVVASLVRRNTTGHPLNNLSHENSHEVSIVPPSAANSAQGARVLWRKLSCFDGRGVCAA